MKFLLKIISPEGSIFEEKIDFVVVPAVEGDLGILARHTPLLAALKAGNIKIKKDNSSKEIKVNAGFLEINESGVYILLKEHRAHIASEPNLN